VSQNAPFEITSLAAVLRVTDMQVSLAYYRDKLGFTVSFTWDDPPHYACLCIGHADLHLNAYEPPTQPSIVCIFCNGVDALHADFAKRGVHIARPVADEPYGMREFVVTDPDGHSLVFGQAISQG
jgi:uncharacterized glyoxalase superfamily protein PhnB